MDAVHRLQDASSSIRLETMCLCVPLRLGVLICAFGTFFSALLYILDRQYWEVEYRPYAGGFCLRSQLILGFVEYTGVLFGWLGVLGAWYVKKTYVAWFNYWQIARLGAWMFMYSVDVPLLQSCEMWVNDVQKMTQEHGWNPTMFQISLAATCPSTRMHFFVKSFLTLLFFMYIVWITAKYVEFIGAVPKHLLRVDKDLPPGAFYAHSHGERTALNGTYGKSGAQPYVHFDPKGMHALHATGGGMTPDAEMHHGYGAGLVGAPIHAPHV